ncbi:MAG: GTPase Era [Rhodothermaceae bacterium]|nr:GTPase Era [Rhodothermaceae bacterium]
METNQPVDPSPAHKCGYVAIIGKPNAGKSTLINALMGQKMSIVTDKPQTTRHRILYLLSEDDYQLIVLDTPGLVEPRYHLHEIMMKNVQRAVEDADLVIFLTDTRTKIPDEEGLKLLGNKPSMLIINKLDLIDERQTLPLAEAYLRKHPFNEIIPVSALKGTNMDVVLKLMIEYLPEGPALYPKDMLSEHPNRFFVSEIIREKIFELFSNEIPYSTQVNIANYKEGDSHRKDVIDAEIVVDKKSQKGILIGKNGDAIKKVGQEAREDIEAFIGRPVYLQLFVKVREDWRNSTGLLNSFGYGKSS